MAQVYGHFPSAGATAPLGSLSSVFTIVMQFLLFAASFIDANLVQKLTDCS